MPDLFRVMPFHPLAGRKQPGHPAYVPASAQGSGRLDNPELYPVVYLSASPAGAVAERFAVLPQWRGSMLDVIVEMRQLRFALAGFDLRRGTVLDLDDPRALLDRALPPSRVVTRERSVTRMWARKIYEERAWAGVSWWSRLDARWTCCGIWTPGALRPAGDPEPLTMDHPAVIEAAAVLQRPILAA